MTRRLINRHSSNSSLKLWKCWVPKLIASLGRDLMDPGSNSRTVTKTFYRKDSVQIIFFIEGNVTCYSVHKALSEWSLTLQKSTESALMVQPTWEEFELFIEAWPHSWWNNEHYILYVYCYGHLLNLVIQDAPTDIAHFEIL